MQINIGLSPEQRKAIADGLAKLLADSYTLYLKTHNFHWNVTGPMFQTLHLLFEHQYTELATAVDEIAERIRALDIYAPGSYAAFSKLTSIKEAIEVPTAHDMINQLVHDQEIVIKTARSLFSVVEGAQDQATLDLLTRRMLTLEKNAWMLRSHLSQ